MLSAGASAWLLFQNRRQATQNAPLQTEFLTLRQAHLTQGKELNKVTYALQAQPHQIPTKQEEGTNQQTKFLQTLKEMQQQLAVNQQKFTEVNKKLAESKQQLAEIQQQHQRDVQQLISEIKICKEVIHSIRYSLFLLKVKVKVKVKLKFPNLNLD